MVHTRALILSLLLVVASVTSFNTAVMYCSWKGTLSTLNPFTGALRPIFSLPDNLLYLETIGLSPTNVYIHGYFADKQMGIWTYDYSGNLQKFVELGTHLPENSQFDSKLGIFVAEIAAGIATLDPNTGNVEVISAFKNPLSSFTEDAGALNPITHVYTTFGALARNPAVTSLVTVDLTAKTTKETPFAAATHMGITDLAYAWKSIGLFAFDDENYLHRVNATNGSVRPIMRVDITPFETGSIEPETGFYSYVGTDGKEKIYVVTLDLANKKVVTSVALPGDATNSPSRLVYSLFNTTDTDAMM